MHLSDSDLTTALARLLSDPDLRAAFRQDRKQAAAQLALHSVDLDTFLGLDEAAIDEQALGLLDKRFHEVSRLIPQTMRGIGDRCRPIFRNYASRHWPTGHRRHLIDAIEFCRHLRERGPWTVFRSEVNWLRFVVYQRRLSIHFVPNIMINGKPRRGVQILYRNRFGRACQLFLFLNI